MIWPSLEAKADLTAVAKADPKNREAREELSKVRTRLLELAAEEKVRIVFSPKTKSYPDPDHESIQGADERVVRREINVCGQRSGEEGAV